MTEANGQSIQVNLNNAQGDLGYLTAGNYYATRVPDLPGSVESYEGYLSVFVKDDTNKLFNFTPYNSKRFTHDQSQTADLSNSGQFLMNISQRYCSTVEQMV